MSSLDLILVGFMGLGLIGNLIAGWIVVFRVWPEERRIRETGPGVGTTVFAMATLSQTMQAFVFGVLGCWVIIVCSLALQKIN